MMIDDMQMDTLVSTIDLEIQKYRKRQEEIVLELQKLDDERTNKITEEMKKLDDEGQMLNNKILVLEGEKGAIIKLKRSQIPGGSIEAAKLNDPRHLEFMLEQHKLAEKQKKKLEEKEGAK